MAGKRKSREIVINDRWKVVKINSMNWQVFEYQEIGAPVNPNGKSREGEYEWSGVEAYFSALVYALDYVRRQIVEDAALGKSLDTLVDTINDANRKAMREILAAVKAVD